MMNISSISVQWIWLIKTHHLFPSSHRAINAQTRPQPTLDLHTFTHMIHLCPISLTYQDPSTFAHPCPYMPEVSHTHPQPSLHLHVQTHPPTDISSCPICLNHWELPILARSCLYMYSLERGLISPLFLTPHSVFPTLDWGWERNFGILWGRDGSGKFSEAGEEFFREGNQIFLDQAGGTLK